RTVALHDALPLSGAGEDRHLSTRRAGHHTTVVELRQLRRAHRVTTDPRHPVRHRPLQLSDGVVPRVGDGIERGAERCGDEVLDLGEELLQLAGDFPKSFHYAVPLVADPLGDSADAGTDRIEAS